MTERLPHAGAKTITELRGPSAQILTLQGIGVQQLQWLPKDRDALEVEIRARVLNTTAGIPPLFPGSQPNIVYELELGHGVYTWQRPMHPVASPPAIASTLRQLYTLPMRGLFVRASVRELKLSFRCLGDFSTPQVPVVESKLAISIQPVLSSFAPAYPRTQFVRFPGGTFGACEFPMEATEFRVRTSGGGIPFAPAVTAIVYIALTGGAVGGADAALLSDWTPIPTQACLYASTATNCEVEFR